MKTTKKGFTLIELIVVIAIIGVLAAILVPSMLGYVRKSKVSSANSAAASVQKAANTALIELDEEGEVVGNGQYSHARSTTTGATALDASDKMWVKISNYMNDAEKVGFILQVTDGVCTAVAATPDGKYTGTYPAGVVTVDNYTSYPATDTGLSTAITAALTKVVSNSTGAATT